MTTKQPEALRLAEIDENVCGVLRCEPAFAPELRRLHAVNADLLEALKEFVSISGDPASFEKKMIESDSDEFARFIEVQEARVQRAIAAARTAIAKATGAPA